MKYTQIYDILYAMLPSKSHHLDQMLTPHSIAVVGASHDQKKIGGILLSNIVSGGFEGKIYPVNPAGGHIQKLRAYKSYQLIPKIPDLAIVAVPAVVVPDVLREIGQKGTKNVIVLSAGFKEIGAQGMAAEQELITIAKQYNLSIIGPNCLGILNAPGKLNATFGEASLIPGNLRFISQSGAIATSFFDWAGKAGLGFDQFITLGNKSVVNENDILEHWQSIALPTQKEISQRIKNGLSPYSPIGLYLESIVDGQKFLEHVKKMCQHQPLFILKPGKSSDAQKAMMSHTGSIAGNDAVLDAALHEAGVIRCHGMEDLFDLSKAFAWEKAPRTNRVAVISNAGGPGVLSADLIAEAGLKIAPLTPKTHATLQANLPVAANINDPIDVLGDALADRYATAIHAVLADKNVDALVVLLTPQMTTQISETAKIISTASAKYGKPIVTAFIGGSQVAKGETILHAHKIPCFRYPDRAIWVLGQMWKWEQSRRDNKLLGSAPLHKTLTRPAQKLLQALVDKQSTILTPLQADRLLDAANISTPISMPVATLGHAEKFFLRHKKIALKISSNALLHKTELHGVIVKIDTIQKLHDAWKKISVTLKKIKRTDPLAEIMAQTHIAHGVELIVGVTTDANFGKVLLFGAGGIMVELLNDRNLHTLPMNEKHIDQVIAKSKINKLLIGYRGSKPLARKKLIKTISQLICLAQAEQIQDIEINPLIVTERDVFAVDGKVVLKS